MSWFKKKSEPSTLTRRTPEEDKDHVQPYAPHAGLTPVSYEAPKVLTQLEDTFDAQVIEFLQKADPDQFNGSFFDPLIQAVETRALTDMEQQKLVHKNTIDSLIAGIWTGDQKRIQNRKANAKEELQEVEMELRAYTRISRKNTALESFEEDSL